MLITTLNFIFITTPKITFKFCTLSCYESNNEEQINRCYVRNKLGNPQGIIVFPKLLQFAGNGLDLRWSG